MRKILDLSNMFQPGYKGIRQGSIILTMRSINMIISSPTRKLTQDSVSKCFKLITTKSTDNNFTKNRSIYKNSAILNNTKRIKPYS